MCTYHILLISDTRELRSSKPEIFAKLVALEHERRTMMTETKCNRFLLSEIRHRCKRARERAFLMLRYCRDYDNAPGNMVLPHRPILKPCHAHTALNPTQCHAATHTAAPNHTENFDRKHCSFSQLQHGIRVICLIAIPCGQSKKSVLFIYAHAGTRVHRDYNASRTLILLREKRWRDCILGTWYSDVGRTAKAIAERLIRLQLSGQLNNLPFEVILNPLFTKDKETIFANLVALQQERLEMTKEARDGRFHMHEVDARAVRPENRAKEVIALCRLHSSPTTCTLCVAVFVLLVYRYPYIVLYGEPASFIHGAMTSTEQQHMFSLQGKRPVTSRCSVSLSFSASTEQRRKQSTH